MFSILMSAAIPGVFVKSGATARALQSASRVVLLLSANFKVTLLSRSHARIRGVIPCWCSRERTSYGASDSSKR